MPSKSKKTTIHALMIGVNAYRGEILLNQRVTFPPLSGCVNDAKKVLAYLQSDPDFKVHAVELYDQNARKSVIVDAFRNHLSKAKKNDIAFLFYSGHGGVEAAQPGQWNDGHLESLICYYDHPHTPDFLLTDKELRFLIRELYDKTQARIVTVFDCCHSGDNTREVFVGGEGAPVRKQVDFVFPPRQWEEFVFAGVFKNPADLAGNLLNQNLPQAPHIQFAAAERDEAALEVGGGGVLTTYLLKTLQSAGGHLTYNDLHSRIRNQMKYLFAQKPKLYAPSGSEDLLDEGFLKKTVGAGDDTANLVYNKKTGWRIDRGVLHGVAQGVTTVYWEQNGESESWPVGAVELDGASVPGVSGIEKKEYKVKLSGLATQTVRLHLVNKNASRAEVQAIVNALTTGENANLVLFDDNKDSADYSLVLWNDLYYVTRPGDLFRPIFRPIPAGEKGVEALARSVRHISGWLLLNGLENKDSAALAAHALRVEFNRLDANGTETPLVFDAHNTADLQYELSPESKKWTGKIGVRFTNTTAATKLYVALLYQKDEFGSTSKLLEPNVMELNAGESKPLERKGKNYLPMVFDPNMRWYNVPFFTDTFKVIVSAQPFETTGLERSALPDPMNPVTLAAELERMRGEVEAKKGGGFDPDEEEVAKPQLSGWTAYTYRLRRLNPEPGAITAQEVQAMLEAGDELAHFALGLYAKPDEKSPFGVNWQMPGDAEGVRPKGIVWDVKLSLANWWMSNKRNRHYKTMLEKHPDAPRFVSEGDSWFQHPLLADIIDNIGQRYPVYCLAAAGDTLQHYVESFKFVNKIKEMQPWGFLLSGGGNDILGETMRGFLNPRFGDAPEGEHPERFFNDTLDRQLDYLMGLYRWIFYHFQQQMPNLKIFVHGYDYPLPLKPGDKAMGWIGRYFDEVKLNRANDRSAAVHYMMDRFNQRLGELAAEFPKTVFYIDLRNTVKTDQWEDEIHPTDEGYREVALKFLGRIEDYLKQK
jgi:hypothetical protein